MSCDFHDQLEAIATLRQICRIVYRTVTDSKVEVEGRIVDVYAANHADYLKLADGTVICLDRLLSVNDKPVSFCAIEATD